MGPLTARILAGLTPFLAAAIFVIGVRIGAHDALLGITLRVPRVAMGAPLLPIEVTLFEDDRTVRERRPNATATVFATRCGKEQTIKLETDLHGDGVIAIPLDAACADRTLTLRVEAAPKKVIFSDTIRLSETPTSATTEGPMVPLGRGPADAPLSVFSLTPAIPAQESSPLWIRSNVGAIASLKVEPEGGLTIDKTTASDCNASLWEVLATPSFHVTGMTVTATFKDTTRAAATWFGAIPIAKGTAAITMPNSLKTSAGREVPFRFPGEREAAYVAIDGISGRVWEARQSPTVPAILPALPNGLYWLHIASEPTLNAERSQLSTRPFLVSSVGECAAVQELLGRAGSLEPVKTDALLEGLPFDSAAQHRFGVIVAIFGLVLGLGIEILIFLSVRAPKLDVDGVSMLQSRKLYIFAGILFTTLVFSLLAMLLWVRVTK